MKTEKSLLQRVQSRISKRRDIIRVCEERIRRHYAQVASCGVSLASPAELRQLKKAVKDGAESQKLDKELFAMLLEQERNKYGQYFRSAYPPVRLSVGFSV